MSSRDPLIGRLLLGRYRIVQRLARGGMGVVYLGRAEGAAGFVRPVVVKHMIHEIADDQMERMFVREARILSRLQHPNVVSVIDFGQENGAYLLVMEYVHGYHLGRWDRYSRSVRGPLPLAVTLHVVIQVLEALHYAHTRKQPDGTPLGIVHRDVSPSNVFVDVEGHVKLLDFGIARMSGDSAEYKTQDFTVKGKLAYLPPEMFQGEPPTPKTDIYSCGVLLHELLVGKNEFRGQEMSDTLHLVMSHEPTRVSAVRDDAPRQIDDVVARALAKLPESRFDDAEQFAQALRDLRGTTEEEAHDRLVALVAEDFHGPLASRLNVPRLDQIEDAWRNPPLPAPETPSTEPPPGRERVSDRPTESLSRVVAAPRKAPWLAVFAVLLVVAGVGAALALRPEPKEGPEVVVIQQSSARDGLADAPPAGRHGAGTGDTAANAEGSPPGADGPPEPPEPLPTEARPTKARTPMDDLSAAFGRQSSRIERCFASHAEDVSGAPRIEVRFTLGEGGRVRRADLLPADLAPTPLGGCILGVARETRFGAAPAGTTFRIPIVARRAP